MSIDATVKNSFIMHWGEMGSRWGINRTVAQVHALLYLTEKPLHAADISEALSVARSNVSGAIKELHTWGLIRVVHLRGDRRDYFEAIHDAWQMFRIIARERKRREVDPIIDIVEQCISQLKDENDKIVNGQSTSKRLSELLQLMKLASGFFDKISALPPVLVKKLLKFDKTIESFLS